MKILMDISDNQGYSPDQIKDSITLGELFLEVEQAIEWYGEDAQIVLSNDQHRGAGYGRIGHQPGLDLFYTAEEGR